MRSPLSFPGLASTSTAWSPPVWTAALLLFIASALLYTLGLERLPHPDELYQILPAEGLLATGEPRIAEGLYTRAYVQTWLIAQSIGLFGPSLSAARLSSLVSIAAVVALLFLWLRHTAGGAAAWLGALGFALSPFAVSTAQFARIYGVQSLAFFLVCLLVYAALVPRRAPGGGGPGSGLRALPGWQRVLPLVLALPLVLLAVHLQPTSLLGLVGLGLWAAGAVCLPWLLDPEIPARRRAGLAAALLAALVLVLAAAWALGLLDELWRRYRAAPLFNQESVDEFWYYHAWYSLLYPSLWPLTGILALAALAAFPRPASLALTVFAAGFLLNSFGGPKNLRYIAYAQPFLFALWGLGLAALWRPLTVLLGGLIERLAAALPGQAAGRIARGLVAASLLFLVIANPAVIRTATLLAEVNVPGEEPSPDWAAARAVLEPWLERAPVVVTTEELGTLYYLGRFDMRFSPSKFGEFAQEDTPAFAADPRTGRPVVASLDELRLVLDCYPEGLFLLASRQWGREHLFNEPVRRLILERAERLPLPPRSRVTAYVWRHAEGAPRPAACAGLPPLPGPTARVPGH